MVRFSDLLGGSGDPEDARPTAVSIPLDAEPEPEPETDEEPETEAAALPVESPRDVLDRLTQYATSARAGDQVPDIPEGVADPAADARTTAETVAEYEPVGDDLLPRSGASKKSGRGRKRRS